MEKEELQKNIAKYYSKLPPKPQEAFSSMKWLEVLQGIDTKYNLTDAQKELLGTETTLVLLCIIPINEYVDKLTKELALPAETIDSIITEINDSIMRPILPELVNTFDENINALGQETETKLDSRFDKLPESIRDIVQKSNYQETLYRLGENYGLNVDEMGLLEKTVVNLIVGHIKPEDFDAILADTLKIPADKAKSLASEVNEKILKEIREKMMGLSGPTEVSKTDKEVLSSAGIEILNGNTSTPPQKSTPQEGNNPLPVPEKLELTGAVKEGPHPILAQKLSETVQTQQVKTEHSVENITKTEPAKTYQKGADPYRLPPV